MTEAEWLTCRDPQQMLGFLKGKTSDRKLRLFVAAYVRWAYHEYASEPNADAAWQAIQVAEQFADASASPAELEAAHRRALDAESLYGNVDLALYFMAVHAAAATSAAVAEDAIKATADDYDGRTAPHAALAIHEDRCFRLALVRDIFGNPFCPMPTNRFWLTPAVLRTAQMVYDDHFNRLPILVRALEQAGCTNADILDHCRGPGPHVRGCWVVDLILGKQ